MPLLQERVAAFKTQELEFYVRKIINLETTTPNNTPLQAVQAKNLLQTLAAHPHIGTVQSFLIYQLATRVIKDAKQSGQGSASASQVMERFRLEPLVGSLLSKVPLEEIYVTEAFVEACVFFGNNTQEHPSFFVNKLKAAINGLTGEGAKRSQAEQLLIILGLFRLYEGPL